MDRVFANPKVVAQAWYPACESRQIRAGQLKTLRLLERRIVFFRGPNGEARSLDAACPHLGADLGLGCLTPHGIECAFHQWVVGEDGQALGHSERRVRSYPTEERWGWIWIFNGPKALYPLPSISGEDELRVVSTPRRFFRCHSHLVVGNGLDTRHQESLHGMSVTTPPRIELPEAHSVRAVMEGRPRSAWRSILCGARSAPIQATFQTYGGGLSIFSVARPDFRALFAATPEGAGCRTLVILFLPKGLLSAFQSVFLLVTLLRRDRAILESLEFSHAMEPGHDEGLMAMAKAVDAAGAW